MPVGEILRNDVICGEDDTMDWYRIGTLFHCIPVCASWNFVYVLSVKK